MSDVQSLASGILAARTEGRKTMDEDLEARLADMEARLMNRINTFGERLIDDLRDVRSEVLSLRTEQETLRALVAGLPTMILAAVEQPLLRRISDHETRLGRLERKDGG